jgi:hypothetical protein
MDSLNITKSSLLHRCSMTVNSSGVFPLAFDLGGHKHIPRNHTKHTKILGHFFVVLKLLFLQIAYRPYRVVRNFPFVICHNLYCLKLFCPGVVPVPHYKDNINFWTFQIYLLLFSKNVLIFVDFSLKTRNIFVTWR